VGLSKRWSIWIDIEGFGKLWTDGNLGLSAINSLMEGIWKIGNRHFPDPENRLFAHQFGDGFVIVSSFAEPGLDRCVAVAIALLRYVTKSGCMARAAIAEGEFSDIQGLRPKPIQDQFGADGHDVVRLGHGLMTLLPVMGTALINANKLDSKNPAKGSILSIATKNLSRLSRGHISTPSPIKPEISMIDWLHSDSEHLAALLSSFGGEFPDSARAEDAIRKYVLSKTPPDIWVADTFHYSNLTS
jgi:hypothetical protein